MGFPKLSSVILIITLAGLAMGAPPAEAKRAKFYTNDQLTLLFSGSRVKATGEFCSVGSGGGNFYVDFIFGTDGRLTLDYECGSRTETLKSRWWVEEDELCLDLKDSSLIEIIPPVKPDGR